MAWLLRVGACLLVLAAGCGDDGGSASPGDRDGDGVADDIDSCPQRPGPSPTGCPQLAFSPGAGPSGSLVTVVGSGFSTNTVVQFDGADARTVFIDNQTVVAVVPFADEASLQPRAPGPAEVQAGGVSASVMFEVTELATTGQAAGSVLAAAGSDAADELDDLRVEIDMGLIAADNASTHPRLDSLVFTSRTAYEQAATALGSLPELGLPAPLLDVAERLLLAEQAGAAAAAVSCSGTELDGVLCQRIDYAARVQRTRQLGRVLCGFGLVMVDQAPALAADIAQACAAASFTDVLGGFVLGVDVTMVDLVGPQAIEVGDEVAYTPTVSVVARSSLELVKPRLLATLVTTAASPLPDVRLEAWQRALTDALYYVFFELQQGTERSGDLSPDNLAWWSPATALEFTGGGRVRLRRQPAYTPVLITVQLDPALQSPLERRRGLIAPCNQSQTCRAAAIGVGAEVASLALTEVVCERLTDVPEAGGGPGLQVAVRGSASGPVAATLGALISQQPGVFVKAAATDCGGWAGGELDCTRTQSQPEQISFDYRLVCADNATTPCPTVPAGLQVNALVSDSGGTTLASRAQFVTCTQ